MAFKILNDVELSMSSDKERKKYKNELEVYQQRAAFVEQFETLENVDIEPYKPTLKPILSVSSPEIKSFKRMETIKPVLPLVSVDAEVKAIYMEKIGKIKPLLPQVAKVAVETKPFEKPEIKHVDLPKVAKPELEGKLFEPPEIQQPLLPHIDKLAVEIKPFEQPGIKPVDLPKVEKPVVEVKTYEQPEIRQP